MLRREIEMLMRERQQLLRIGGAAAMFVAELDSVQLPEATWGVAEFLAESLNGLAEETLQDALEATRASLQQAPAASS